MKPAVRSKLDRKGEWRPEPNGRLNYEGPLSWHARSQYNRKHLKPNAKYNGKEKPWLYFDSDLQLEIPLFVYWSISGNLYQAARFRIGRPAYSLRLYIIIRILIVIE